MSGLTPQMLAAIQAAGQAGGGAATPGASDASIGSAMNNALSSSGLFSPQDLAAVNSTWNTSGNWGNGAPTPDIWDNQIQNAINGVQQNQQTVGQFQQPTNAAEAAGYNPLQPAYLSQPATMNATTVNPSYLSSQLMGSLGSGQTIAQLQAGVAPQNQQQDQQMMQMLATAGLAPSSTAGQTAFNNLAQQQNAGIAPSIASAIQNSQGNQLNAGQFNANAGNQSSQYNAGAMNTAAAQNLQNQLAQQQYNANAYNNAGQQYFNAQTGAYENNANAFNALNTAGLAGAQNAAGQQISGGNQLAGQTINTFPTFGGNSTAYGALGSALGGSGGSSAAGAAPNAFAPNSAGFGFQGAGDAGAVSDAGV